MSMGRLCVNLLKKILLLAGIKPVTFSLVCTLWQRIIDNLSMREKWGHQLELAKRDGIYCTDIFDFAIFDEADDFASFMEEHIIYFVQKPKPCNPGYQYHGNCMVQRYRDQIMFEFPKMRLYGRCELYASLRVYGDQGYALVTGLNAFHGQYVWNGEVYCTELRNRFGICAFGVIAHGVGDAFIQGIWFHHIRAEFGCLYPEGGTVTFPDMTQNLFQ